jgi:sugar fermentation stimulation protein A
MRFDTPLVAGRLVRRYRRFLADVRLSDGSLITAHCPSSGSMRTCLGEGWPVRLRPNDSPRRKHRYTLEMLHNGTCWIAVDTQLANRLVAEAIRNGTISELAGYSRLRTEVRTGTSRLDLLLSGRPGTGAEAPVERRGEPAAERLCYVEIKTVTMLDATGRYAFPDAVTERGRRHLGELVRLVGDGHRAVILYLVLRSDGHGFAIAGDIDPAYRAATAEALAAGVEPLVYRAEVSPEEIRVRDRITTGDQAVVGTTRPPGDRQPTAGRGRDRPRG